MGRATRWLKSLFGIRREKEQKQNSDCVGPKSMKWPSSESTTARVLCHSPATIPPNISQAEAAWLQSFYAEKEQNNRVIADAAVVRLTSHQRGNMFGVGHETCAAIKIQTIFRGYLARKAHRALKGLVKLQALVRGYLVRKQATATFHSMQALVRAQATIMSHKSQRLKCRNNEARGFQNQVRRSKERFHDTRNEYATPIHHSRRLSSSLDATINNNNSVDGSPKIVEVDISRPISRSRRTNTTISDFGDDPLFQALSSPFSYRTPARLSTPNHRNLHESEWGLTGEECRFSSSAQSTPMFANSCGCGTPKSVCNDNFFVGKYYPNYMASTQSFKAKLRSHSAPKQRPEPSSRKRLSLNEMMECRKSLSGVRMRRSCSQVQQVVNFKNAVMDRLQKSTEYVGETHRNYF